MITASFFQYDILYAVDIYTVDLRNDWNTFGCIEVCTKKWMEHRIVM